MRFLAAILLTGVFFNVLHPQQSNITLTFTGSDFVNERWVELNHINITNITKNCDTTIFYPDTLLMLEPTYINELNVKAKHFEINQYISNTSETFIEIRNYQDQFLHIEVFDLFGTNVNSFKKTFLRGSYVFSFQSPNINLYIMTVSSNEYFESIKIIGRGGEMHRRSTLTLIEAFPMQEDYKLSKTSGDFIFENGDELRFTVFANNYLETSVIDSPNQDHNYSFALKIFDGFNCGETFTDPRDGRSYPTVQISSQCWFKTNLNYEIGNNWCYNNLASYCETHGRLYDWESAMNACPEGWYLPTDFDWKVLEGFADSQLNYEHGQWNVTGERGTDVGYNLKSVNFWSGAPNGIDKFGFRALPGGAYVDGSFVGVGWSGFWWTSSVYDASIAWERSLSYFDKGSFRYGRQKTNGYSVRCFRNNLATIETEKISEITPNSAVSGGNIFSKGLYEVDSRGVIWHTSTKPTLENHTGITSDGNGDGMFTSNLNNLEAETTYFVRAYVTNIAGSNFGETYAFNTNLHGMGIPCPDFPTVTDSDGNIYNTTMIGNQCWFKENLKKETYGSSCYDDDPENCVKYGRLYPWDEAKNACPEGWHLPSNSDWNQLINFIEIEYGITNTNNPNSLGNYLKSCRQSNSPLGGDCNVAEHPRWNSNNLHFGNDIFGFSALPGGRMSYSGTYSNIGTFSNWWSATSAGYDYAWSWGIGYQGGKLYGPQGDEVIPTEKDSQLSVRCVRNINSVKNTD